METMDERPGLTAKGFLEGPDPRVVIEFDMDRIDDEEYLLEQMMKVWRWRLLAGLVGCQIVSRTETMGRLATVLQGVMLAKRRTVMRETGWRSTLTGDEAWLAALADVRRERRMMRRLARARLARALREAREKAARAVLMEIRRPNGDKYLVGCWHMDPRRTMSRSRFRAWYRGARRQIRRQESEELLATFPRT